MYKNKNLGGFEFCFRDIIFLQLVTLHPALFHSRLCSEIPLRVKKLLYFYNIRDIYYG